MGEMNMTNKKSNTHTNRATSYDIGRPNYPDTFFEYLYDLFNGATSIIIADIGAGTGKVTKRFLDMGNKVFAVEPDNDMMGILKANLALSPNLTILETSAENTGLASNSVELIFCGNSYMWFDREYVVPEFQRIVKNHKIPNIVIARLGAGSDAYAEELLEIGKKFAKAASDRIPNNVMPFQEGMYTEKVFKYSIFQSYNEFLHGFLSASYAPTAEDDCFENYCSALRFIFDKYSVNGKIEGNFILSCYVGRVENLMM